MPAPFRFASYRVHFQISKSELDGLFGSPTPQQRSDTGQELREREGFHKVIVGTLVESFDPILDCIAGSEDESRSPQSTLSECGQHLKPVAAGQHEIQKHKIELLGVNEEESFFSGWRNDNFVFLALQSLPKGTSHLRFVFHNKDSQVSCSPFCILCTEPARAY